MKTSVKITTVLLASLILSVQPIIIELSVFYCLISIFILVLGITITSILIHDIRKLESKTNSKITNDKFVKILIACGVNYDLLENYKWEVIELEPHKYHCIGNHPVAKRIDIIMSNIIV